MQFSTTRNHDGFLKIECKCPTKGYKALNIDFRCRGKKYEVGKVHVENEEPKLCIRGMHYCENIVDVFTYYECNPSKTVVVEVNALGSIDWDLSEDKYSTNKLEIIRVVPWEEIAIDLAYSYSDGITKTPHMILDPSVMQFVTAAMLKLPGYEKYYEIVRNALIASVPEYRIFILQGEWKC